MTTPLLVFIFYRHVDAMHILLSDVGFFKLMRVIKHFKNMTKGMARNITGLSTDDAEIKASPQARIMRLKPNPTRTYSAKYQCWPHRGKTSTVMADNNAISVGA
ncbi:hypothetical protein [Ewingella americana]